MTNMPTWSSPSPPPPGGPGPQGGTVQQGGPVPQGGPGQFGASAPTGVPGQQGNSRQASAPSAADQPVTQSSPGGSPQPSLPAEGFASAPLGPVRVDLLPPPYRHRLSILAAQRRAKIAIGCTAGVVLLVSAISFVQAGLSSTDVSDARSAQLAAQSQVNKYSEVPRLAAQLNEIKTGLTDALAAEVLFSEMITSVGKTLPSGVSVSSLTFSLAATAGQTGGSTTTSSTGGAGAAGAEVGLVSITGTAPSLDAISTFIQNLENSGDFDTVTLTSATRGSTGAGSGSYTFSATANLSKGALSGRYAKDGIKPK